MRVVAFSEGALLLVKCIFIMTLGDISFFERWADMNGCVSLSVRPSVYLSVWTWPKTGENNSFLRKYWGLLLTALCWFHVRKWVRMLWQVGLIANVKFHFYFSEIFLILLYVFLFRHQTKALVSFDSEMSVSKALKLNGQIFCNQPMYIRSCSPKDRQRLQLAFRGTLN